MKWLEKIRSLDINELRLVVSQEHTYKHVLEHFGFKATRNKKMYDSLRKVMDENNIDYSHFGYNKVTDLSKQLIKNSTYNNQTLKKRLIKEGLLEYKCQLCGNNGFWNNKELVLQLDHINGDNHDNRLSNLRFLCPNCHSQTETFSGRNLKSVKNSSIMQKQ